MSHSTTTSTFDQILQLEDERRQLMDKLSSEDGGGAADRARLSAIGRELTEQHWPSERAARVRMAHGRPELLSDNRPASHTRKIAHGIAPLTKGDRYDA